VQTLTGASASRLQERLEMLATFRAAQQELPDTWHIQAKSTAAAKELPPWWTSVHDAALVKAVLKHGFGNWTAMFEVRVCERGEVRGVDFCAQCCACEGGAAPRLWRLDSDV
jgi:hypothetical protein